MPENIHSYNIIRGQCMPLYYDIVSIFPTYSYESYLTGFAEKISRFYQYVDKQMPYQQFFSYPSLINCVKWYLSFIY